MPLYGLGTAPMTSSRNLLNQRCCAFAQLSKRATQRAEGAPEQIKTSPLPSSFPVEGKESDIDASLFHHTIFEGAHEGHEEMIFLAKHVLSAPKGRQETAGTSGTTATDSCVVTI